jgi:hypothetical protein
MAIKDQRHCIIIQSGSELLEPRGQSNVTRTDEFRQKHKSHRGFLNLYLYAKKLRFLHVTVSEAATLLKRLTGRQGDLLWTFSTLHRNLGVVAPRLLN